MFAIELGSEVRDLLTGFKGFVHGRVEYITGCNQYLVRPQVADDGKFPECQWLDEHRLNVTGSFDNLPIDVRTVLDRKAAGAERGADTSAPVK